jgi:hypothetical protein
MKTAVALIALTAVSLMGASNMGASNTDAISVTSVSGRREAFPVAGKVTVVVFYSTICPISNEYNERIRQLYHDYSPKGVQILVMNANQNESREQVRDHIRAAEFDFPIYLDTRNVVADRLGASVTPESFVIDASGAVRYHGPIDDARNPARIHVHLLRDSIDAVLAGKPVAKPEAKAFGCTIKRVR